VAVAAATPPANRQQQQAAPVAAAATPPAAPAAAVTAAPQQPAAVPPAEPSAQPAAAVSAASSTYTVRPGDSLWTIAGNPQIFNDPFLWPSLYEANRERFVDPANPHLIETGQTFQIPWRKVTANARYYLARPGDSFTRIAAHPAVYNDQYQWERLYNANKSRIPDPNNPHLMYMGTVIEIPSLNGETRDGIF
jgi:nucleoid-associated protein YgaU